MVISQKVRTSGRNLRNVLAAMALGVMVQWQQPGRKQKMLLPEWYHRLAQILDLLVTESQQRKADLEDFLEWIIERLEGS